MGKLWLGFAAGMACALLAGCATYAPPRGAPTADLIMRRTTLIDSQQAQMFYRSADWSRRTVMGDGILYAYDKPFPVEAGVRTYVEVEMLQYQGISELYCLNWFSFTPQAGRSYEVLPHHRVHDCSIEVRDLATGAPPRDLKLESDPDRR